MTSPNSPTGKNPSAPITVAEQNLKLQEGLANAGAYIAQLQRILWLTVQAAGGQVTLDESKVEPLWRLDKKRLEDGKLSLQASVTPPPAKEAIERLASKLMGTNTRIEEVQKELGLEEWPPDYLAFQLRDRLALSHGHWVDARLARGMSSQTGQN